MLLFCISFFPIIHESSPSVVSMFILKSSTIGLVTSVQFSKAPSLLNFTNMHKCFFIPQYCFDESNDSHWGSFGCSGKYLEHSSLCTHYSENGSETLDGIQVLEYKIYVNKFSWFKVGGVNSCSFR